MTFDPNGVGIANGNLFGFPVTEQEANLVIIPIPWDATASYGKGTSKGPQAILDASTQLDFYHPKLDKAYETKVFMTEISSEWQEINDRLCSEGCDYIAFLEDGGVVDNHPKYQQFLLEINAASNALKENLKSRAKELIAQGKIVAVLGGEHSTPLGLIEALNETGKEFGVLQIDAHADLREAYEGRHDPRVAHARNVASREYAAPEGEHLRRCMGRGRHTDLEGHRAVDAGHQPVQALQRRMGRELRGEDRDQLVPPRQGRIPQEDQRR